MEVQAKVYNSLALKTALKVFVIAEMHIQANILDISLVVFLEQH